MKKLFALLMLFCLGMFVVACGPAGDDSPSSNGEETGSTEDGGDTANDVSDDTGVNTSDEDVDDATADKSNGDSATADESADDTPEQPLVAPEEDINLSLDPPKED